MSEQGSHPAKTERRRKGNGPLEKGGRDPGKRRPRRPPHLETSVNMDELRELVALFKDNSLAEFELERAGFKVHLRRDVSTQELDSAATGPDQAQQSGDRASARGTSLAAAKTPITIVPSHPGAQAETAASEDQDLYIITSPIVGTFYRAPSPNVESFVKIGSQVEAETVVCIIEAMKLMNEIQAETSGEVAKIYVENGQPVEYGQPLFGIKK